MDLPSWAPESIDVTRPSAARVYDYILGGAHNFAVDRELGDELIRRSPDVAETMRANRVFLRRAVRYLAEQGIRQFLDIGSGVPTVGNVHEIAQQVSPESTVVYVDMDPVAVAHSEAILEGNDRAGVICADMREPELIKSRAAASGLIDFAAPVALLLAGVVHFIPDSDDPGGLVAQLRDPLVAGSYLLVSHTTYDGQPPEVVAAQQLAARTATPLFPRTHAEVLSYFDGTELIDPGLVFIPLWRPDPGEVVEHPERTSAYAGVSSKR
ncbi:MAG TPA: SAM-dependent methyltransferase [Rugosimonospora sp.]|nr:SAM-dependent methyltransferase [Rugosimonospora sp.]